MISARFELYQAKDFQDPMQEGISLYLYRITPAGEIRNYPPRQAKWATVQAGFADDLCYLLSSWAREATKQQRLLGGPCAFWKTHRYFPPAAF